MKYLILASVVLANGCATTEHISDYNQETWVKTHILSIPNSQLSTNNFHTEINTKKVNPADRIKSFLVTPTTPNVINQTSNLSINPANRIKSFLVTPNTVSQPSNLSTNNNHYINTPQYSGGVSHYSGGPVHVNGYYRRNGTYVHSYTRSAPHRR